jgi:hypothetical protein
MGHTAKNRTKPRSIQISGHFGIMRKEMFMSKRD